MLGVNALFATAYGNVGSSIYYALGLVASFALGLTPVVFVITGIDAPYEEPADPDVHLRAGEEPAERSVERILAVLEARSRQVST